MASTFPLCVAGVALGDIHVPFAWQAWHLWHWAGSGSRVTPRQFVWQARPLATSTFPLRGRWHLAPGDIHILHGKRGTYGTGLGLVARLVPVGRP